jgi:ribosomal protein S27AE
MIFFFLYRGGGKKRKKKNYTTPKKIKHKHRKVKLAVLKYYKVDDNGKINRLRRECPAEECGAGVFMAAHFDRWEDSVTSFMLFPLTDCHVRFLVFDL